MVTVTYFLDSFALVACKTDERSLVGVSPTPPDVMRQRPYGWKGAKRQRSRIAIHMSVAGPGPKAPWGRAGRGTRIAVAAEARPGRCPVSCRRRRDLCDRKLGIYLDWIPSNATNHQRSKINRT